MRNLLDRLMSDWILLSGPEVEILKKSAENGRIIIVGYMGKTLKIINIKYFKLTLPLQVTTLHKKILIIVTK